MEQHSCRMELHGERGADEHKGPTLRQMPRYEGTAVSQQKGAAKAPAGKSLLSGCNLHESSPSNPASIGMQKQQADGMLRESIPILRRILQGFDEATLTPHAWKQIQKENPVDNFFCPEKVSQKNVLAKQSSVLDQLHPQKQVCKRVIHGFISELLPKGEDT